MSTTEITRQSPVSSPINNYNHRHTPQNGSRSSTARVMNNPAVAPLSTPRPNPKRHQSAKQTQTIDSSPNYFNLSKDSVKSVGTSAGDGLARNKLPPSSSNIRPTAVTSPKVMPLDQNPDFEEFRRQSELRFANNGGFNFTGPNSINASSPPRREPILQPRSPTLASPSSKRGPSALDDILSSSQKPRSPKRALASPYFDVTNGPRRDSPASFTERESVNAPSTISFLAKDYVDFSLPATTDQSPLTSSNHGLRAETLPTGGFAQLDPDKPPFASVADIATLMETYPHDFLLLDLRVTTSYLRSRIHGALNLCIPTTLLKRASYNTSRLAETFNHNTTQKSKFERWRNFKYIIVYDGSASKAKDAAACVSMLKKFASEGWNGESYVIRGGFGEFSRSFPNMIRYGSSSQSGSESPPASSRSSGGHSLAPVIGGCPMPISKNAANPFFSNIRQNMELHGGVGQIPVLLPPALDETRMSSLPKWLQNVAREESSGKTVSRNYDALERQELARMSVALDPAVRTDGDGNDKDVIQVDGMEKGAKNRYNNIWPFKHTRVKIQGVPRGDCDYFNANHIKAAWSNKRYIATQGPIPATFNDFWNVVWQQDVRVIVMLTAEMESGQIKAHNYWNDEEYGHFRLKLLTEKKSSLEPAKLKLHKIGRPPAGPRRSTTSVLGKASKAADHESQLEIPYVTIRRFALHNAEEPSAGGREITHMQYSNWPDFGAPAHPAHLLGLVEQCEKAVQATSPSSLAEPAPPGSRPVVVHCSAGCGRTGTFCTVDSVLDMLKRQKNHHHDVPHARMLLKSSTSFAGDPMEDVKPTGPGALESSNDKDDISPFAGHGERNWLDSEDIDLIAKTVGEFRTQRLSMVQSLRQLSLCYESILEWWMEQSPKSA